MSAADQVRGDIEVHVPLIDTRTAKDAIRRIGTWLSGFVGHTNMGESVSPQPEHGVGTSLVFFAHQDFATQAVTFTVEMILAAIAAATFSTVCPKTNPRRALNAAITGGAELAITSHRNHRAIIGAIVTAVALFGTIDDAVTTKTHVSTGAKGAVGLANLADPLTVDADLSLCVAIITLFDALPEMTITATSELAAIATGIFLVVVPVVAFFGPIDSSVTASQSLPIGDPTFRITDGTTFHAILTLLGDRIGVVTLLTYGDDAVATL